MLQMTLDEASYFLKIKRQEKEWALQNDNLPKTMELTAGINYLTGYITGVCDTKGLDKSLYL